MKIIIGLAFARIDTSLFVRVRVRWAGEPRLSHDSCIQICGEDKLLMGYFSGYRASEGVQTRAGRPHDRKVGRAIRN